MNTATFTTGKTRGVVPTPRWIVERPWASRSRRNLGRVSARRRGRWHRRHNRQGQIAFERIRRALRQSEDAEVRQHPLIDLAVAHPAIFKCGPVCNAEES
jgi:hypothetical protein